MIGCKLLVVVFLVLVVSEDFAKSEVKNGRILLKRVRRDRFHLEGEGNKKHDGEENGKRKVDFGGQVGQKKDGNEEKDEKDSLKWKNNKKLGINEEHAAEFEEWKKKHGKGDEHAEEFLNFMKIKWPKTPDGDNDKNKGPKLPDDDKEKKQKGPPDVDQAEFIKWNLEHAKRKGTVEDFKKWKKEKENKEKKGNDKSEKEEDGTVRGPCFKNATKPMKNKVELCKCELPHKLEDMLPPSAKPFMASMLKSAQAESSQRTAKGKRKKCNLDAIESALKRIDINIFPMFIRVCFWEKMNMLVRDSNGHASMSFSAVKDVMAMFNTEPKVLEEVQKGIDNCINGPLPDVDLPEIVTKILDKLNMPVEELKKAKCIGIVYQTYCTDVKAVDGGPQGPTLPKGGGGLGILQKPDHNKGQPTGFGGGGVFGNETGGGEGVFDKLKGGGEHSGKEKGGGEHSGTEKGGGEHSGKEKGGGEHSGKEKGGGEHSGKEKGGGEHSGKEKGGGEHSGKEKGGGEHSGKEKGGGEHTGKEKGGVEGFDILKGGGKENGGSGTFGKEKGHGGFGVG